MLVRQKRYSLLDHIHNLKKCSVVNTQPEAVFLVMCDPSMNLPVSDLDP
jgi:hypothetical protein